MLSFPNCKINLGLNIVGKRDDGYHDIETVFYPLQLQDALEIIRAGDDAADVHFKSTGLPIAGNTSDNLCIKAYHLLKQDHPALPSIHMHLHKTIPMGAGLGGGSADGAFTLQLLNNYFKLGIPAEQLAAYALQLGSDCPYFLLNKPAFAQGRGEILTPVALDLSAWQFLLVHPGIHISTAWAFSQIVPKKPVVSVASIVAQPIENWKAQLVNDFEQAVGKEHASIAALKQKLYANGAVYASMTGSGSTLFGIFPKKSPLPLSAFRDYAVTAAV